MRGVVPDDGRIDLVLCGLHALDFAQGPLRRWQEQSGVGLLDTRRDRSRFFDTTRGHTEMTIEVSGPRGFGSCIRVGPRLPIGLSRFVQSWLALRVVPKHVTFRVLRAPCASGLRHDFLERCPPPVRVRLFDPFDENFAATRLGSSLDAPQRHEPNGWISGLDDGGGRHRCPVHRLAVMLSRCGRGRDHERKTEAGNSLRGHDQESWCTTAAARSVP